jgi:hypothetical protein
MVIVFVTGAAVGVAGALLLSPSVDGRAAEDAAPDSSAEREHVPADHVDIDRLVRERSKASLAMIEQIGHLQDEKEYDAAVRKCSLLATLDPGMGMLLLGGSCAVAGKGKEFVDYSLSIYDFARENPAQTMTGVFQALERSDDLFRGWDILRERERTLPPDVVAYYRAGLLAIDGRRDEALELLAPLRDDPFWRSSLGIHPLESGSFLPERRRFDGKARGKYPGGWEHPMFPEELLNEMERSGKALLGGEDR